MIFGRKIAVKFFAMYIVSAQAAFSADCALGLAFALDVSSSVNSAEYEIQKGGLADALRNPEVREAILVNPGDVRFLAYEWSGALQQAIIVGWSVMSNAAAIDRFAASLDAHQRLYAKSSTALGQGIAFGVRQFAALPATCDRQVIDVSGDGVSNDGVTPDALRASGRLNRITINGLVIKGASPDPESYYREKVIHGPDAFMMTARNGFEDYPDLIKGKLLKELRPPIFIGVVR